MVKLIGRIIGMVLNVIFIPFVLILAVPAGILKARRSAKARLLFTGEEQSLIAKAQRAIAMDGGGLLSPDADLLEVAQCIDKSRIQYQTIKGRERYDATFIDFLLPKLNDCKVGNWDKVEHFFNLTVLSPIGNNRADLEWRKNLCNWLNRVMTVGADEMTVEDLFRDVKGSFDPSTIAKVERIVLGDFQAGRGISDLPDSLFELRALRSLHLQRNNIKQLSERIGQLCNLEELKLGFNPLSSLPASIGDLKKLRILTLWGTNVASLPPQIGKLSELEGLDVSACANLKKLPDEITKLRKLKKLCLPQHDNFKLTAEQESWTKALLDNGAEVWRSW